MPVYEYACEKCGHEFERAQRITEDPVKTCPACRSRRVRRLISRTAFVLKGSGWYSDLYASKKPGGKEGSASDKDVTTAGAKDASESGGKEPAKEAGAAESASESKSSSDSKSESKGSKAGSKSKGKSKTPKAAA